MYKMVELLYMAVILFQGYCLQYFLGSFLESRWKSRWNGLCVAVLYTVGLYGISGMFEQALGTGYNGYREAVWKLALSLCILVVFALCFYKAYHEAVRLVPDLEMDADKLVFPQDLKIHSYDIGIILGNAVDNAVRACRKLKEKEPGADAFIRFVTLQKGNLLVLKVENSFDGKLVRKPGEEFPVTDKTDKENHGMGLANIKNMLLCQDLVQTKMRYSIS